MPSPSTTPSVRKPRPPPAPAAKSSGRVRNPSNLQREINQRQQSQTVARKLQQKTKVQRQRQAQEEANDFEGAGDDDESWSANEEEQYESEDPADYEPPAQEPFTFEEVQPKKKLIRRAPPRPPSPVPDSDPEANLLPRKLLNLKRRANVVPRAKTPDFEDITLDFEGNQVDIMADGTDIDQQDWSLTPPPPAPTSTPRAVISGNTVAHQPVSLGKRKSPPTQADTLSNIRVIKTSTFEASGTRGRLTAKDLPTMFQSILSDAQGRYRTLLCARAPFGDAVEKQDLAALAWGDACKHRRVAVEFKDDFCRLIIQRASQVRGKLKVKARPIVKAAMGFKTTNGVKATIRQNREQYEDRMEKSAYLYKDPVARKGIYESSIIQELVNEMWYTDKTDEGVVYGQYFGSEIPEPTICLLNTVIENCLDEWAEGEHHDIAFTGAAYEKSFDAHMKTIQAFGEHTKALKVMPKICTRLLQNARRHAKVSPDNDQVATSLLSVDDFTAASTEWEGRSDESVSV